MNDLEQTLVLAHTGKLLFSEFIYGMLASPIFVACDSAAPHSNTRFAPAVVERDSQYFALVYSSKFRIATANSARTNYVETNCARFIANLPEDVGFVMNLGTECALEITADGLAHLRKEFATRITRVCESTAR